METYWPVALAVEALTQRPNAIGDPYGRMGDRVRQTIARHGAEATMAAYRAIAERAQAETGKPPTVRQLVFGADDRLDPIPTTRASDRDCPTCLNTGVTATGARCPDCHRGKADR